MAYNKYPNNRVKSRVKERNKDMKKCPYCNNVMRYKGSGDSSGWYYWKCKNKHCGRTVWVKKMPPKEVIPLVYSKGVLR